jgi:hypothetical protein
MVMESKMDIADVLKLLRTSQSGIIELAEVTTYIGYRRGTDDTEREITVEILDAGPDAGENRYVVEVTEEHGDGDLDDDLGDEVEQTIHAAGASLELAIAALPWDELDEA